MIDLVDAIFHGLTVALILIYFIDAKHQTEISKIQNRRIDTLQRKIKELEEDK